MKLNGGDAIDEAVAAVDAPTTVQMRQWNVTISSTGRPAVAMLPADATDAELAEFAGWILTSVMGQYRARRSKGIILP